MGNTISFLLSLLVILPLLAGIVKYKKIDRPYHPFIALLAIALLSEIMSRVSIKLFDSNTVVIGIYSIVECLLLLLLFHRWRPYSTTKTIVGVLAIVLVSVWLIENIVLWRIVSAFSPVFRICYSFVIVMLSVNEINYLITHQNRNLLRNARFILCIGFLIYFLYQILLEGAYYISTTKNPPEITNNIFSLQVYVNAFCNLVYLLGVLLIPQKSFYNFEEKLISMKNRKNKSDNM